MHVKRPLAANEVMTRLPGTPRTGVRQLVAVLPLAIRCGLVAILTVMTDLVKGPTPLLQTALCVVGSDIMVA